MTIVPSWNTDQAGIDSLRKSRVSVSGVDGSSPAKKSIKQQSAINSSPPPFFFFFFFFFLDLLTTKTNKKQNISKPTGSRCPQLPRITVWRAFLELSSAWKLIFHRLLEDTYLQFYLLWLSFHWATFFFFLLLYIYIPLRLCFRIIIIFFYILFFFYFLLSSANYNIKHTKKNENKKPNIE